ncbi:unnamed protein product [Closterium sp. NIES-54]
MRCAAQPSRPPTEDILMFEVCVLWCVAVWCGVVRYVSSPLSYSLPLPLFLLLPPSPSSLSPPAPSLPTRHLPPLIPPHSPLSQEIKFDPAVMCEAMDRKCCIPLI